MQLRISMFCQYFRVVPESLGLFVYYKKGVDDILLSGSFETENINRLLFKIKFIHPRCWRLYGNIWNEVVAGMPNIIGRLYIKQCF